jgi:uncharacterized protein YndB with AHSA1/START domain
MNGKLERSGDGWALRFERTFPHPPEKVWRAITEPEHLAAWFPDTIVLSEWKVGAPLRFEHPGGGFDGEVLTVEEGSLLAFRWGTDVIRLEITPEGSGTRLTLVDTIDQLGKAARDAAGWHACLDQLEAHLAGASGPPVSDTWHAVHPHYVESFGPEAATIGPPEDAP